MPKIDLERMRSILVRALEGGGLRTIGPTTFHWDVSGDCQDAHGVTLEARPTRKQWLPLAMRWAAGVPLAVRIIDDARTPVVLTMHVRCRLCPACIKQRSIMWATRASFEIAGSTRSWFGTLTARPMTHAIWITRARSRYSGDWNLLPPGEQFERHAAEMQKEITLFLKRLRKRSGTKFRYLAVIEAHSDKLRGYPHGHILLHETADRVLWEQLRAEWRRHGFSKWSLCEDKTNPEFKRDATAAWYTCKYLTKGLQCRVRASLHYGQNHLGDRSMTSALAEASDRDLVTTPSTLPIGVSPIGGGSGGSPPPAGVSPDPRPAQGAFERSEPNGGPDGYASIEETFLATRTVQELTP